MEEKYLTNTCSFAQVKPIMTDLPYPPIRVQARSQAYADLLGVDYCGSVSEMSAVTQYINNENRLACEDCPVARVLLGIAMAEMMHMQKLGELIWLLGGRLDYSAKCCSGGRRMWTPECLTIPERLEEMLSADIDAEMAAIDQYKRHIRQIGDCYVTAVLRRIIQDEEYHIMLLKELQQSGKNLYMS